MTFLRTKKKTNTSSKDHKEVSIMHKQHKTFSIDEGGLVFGPSSEVKSLLPDNGLPMKLATDAFKIIGTDKFEVSAELDARNPKSLMSYKLFQNILMMAYQEGQKNPQTNQALS